MLLVVAWWCPRERLRADAHDGGDGTLQVKRLLSLHSSDGKLTIMPRCTNCAPPAPKVPLSCRPHAKVDCAHAHTRTHTHASCLAQND
jgi:hypothetical protein